VQSNPGTIGISSAATFFAHGLGSFVHNLFFWNTLIVRKEMMLMKNLLILTLFLAAMAASSAKIFVRKTGTKAPKKQKGAKLSKLPKAVKSTKQPKAMKSTKRPKYRFLESSKVPQVSSKSPKVSSKSPKVSSKSPTM
jgi:hypothetical protein